MERGSKKGSSERGSKKGSGERGSKKVSGERGSKKGVEREEVRREWRERK